VEKECITDNFMTDQKLKVLKTFKQQQIIDFYSMCENVTEKRRFNESVECLNLDIFDCNFHNLIKKKQGRVPPTEISVKQKYSHQHGDKFEVKKLTPEQIIMD
jgi:hypothetical protein